MMMRCSLSGACRLNLSSNTCCPVLHWAQIYHDEVCPFRGRLSELPTLCFLSGYKNHWILGGLRFSHCALYTLWTYRFPVSPLLGAGTADESFYTWMRGALLLSSLAVLLGCRRHQGYLGRCLCDWRTLSHDCGGDDFWWVMPHDRMLSRSGRF